MDPYTRIEYGTTFTSTILYIYLPRLSDCVAVVTLVTLRRLRYLLNNND